MSTVRKTTVALAVAGLLVMACGTSQAALVGYWQFEGNASDSSGSFNNGTLQGGAGFAAGLIGQALSLNGGGQYVSTVPVGNLGLNGSFTASAWVNPTATNGDRTIYGNVNGPPTGGLHLVIRGDRAHLGFYGNDTPGNAIIPTNQWSHITWQYDAGTQTQRIIVNGVLDAETGGHAAFTGTETVDIGRWGGGNYFAGLLDQATVFNTALAPNQIIHLATGGDPTALPAAVPAWSRFLGSPSGPVLLGPVLPNGKRNAYQLVTHAQGLTWDEARVDAGYHTYQGAQGHLATVHNGNENAFVHAFGGGDRWIGLADSGVVSTLDGATAPGAEGNFQWVTGEPRTFTAWGGGEPNDAGGEDAANIRGDSLWNDLPSGSSLGQGDHRLGSYVIEYEVQSSAAGGQKILPKLGPVLPDGTRSAYEYVATSLSWTAAKADAASRQYLGVQGHLVAIANQAEQNFVQSLGNGWIGLTDEPGQAPGAFEGGNQGGLPQPANGSTPVAGQKGYGWAWVTGEPLVFHNWNGGEPNGDTSESFAEITPGWNDLSNGNARAYTVEYNLTAQAQRSIRSRYIQIDNNGANVDFNFTGETYAAMLGYGAGPAGSQFRITTDITSNPTNDPYEADFAGGGGNFGFNNPYYPGAPGDPGDDFAVRATARVFIPEGDWTIAFASDDGGLVHLDHVQFLGQFGTNVDTKANDGTALYQGPRGHSATGAYFSVPAGGITTNLDSLFFERGGGDSFEVSIAPGHWPGFNNQAFGILADGQFGWRVTPQDPQPGFNVRMIQLDPNNTGGDNEINTALEAVGLVGLVGLGGPGNYGPYNVTTVVNTTAPYVDFGFTDQNNLGVVSGDFNEPTLLYPDGRGDPGEDFLVAAQAFMRVPAGTYTIAFAGDDGGVLRLINTHGAPIQFSQEINTNGDGVLDDTILFNDVRGHDRTMGVFTLTAEAYLDLQSLFFERGGGDSFEISIAKGAFTSFNTTDFFILRNGVFPGLLLAPDLLSVVPEPSAFALFGLGAVGLALAGRRWRKR